MNSTDPFDCVVLNDIGIISIIVLIISVLSNLMLIWLLVRYNKELLNGINLLVLAVSILNLIGTIVAFPILRITSFKCR